ncbi:MAG TPA: hypothetical protein VMT42_07015 [candidate division Zixibacteria bacterium]|nr:hypothetical protein [candidate division Zixibacteria bacterium]
MTALKVWLVRFVRFNLIGTGVFCLATLVYWVTFPAFQVWAWFMANSFGGLLQFWLTTKFNKNSRTMMFESAKKSVGVIAF